MTYFGLPRDVRTGDVGVVAIDGVGIHLEQKILPGLAAMPVGWTHSLAVCQNVLDGFARQLSGVNAGNSLVDRKVVPTSEPMIRTEYADNVDA